VVRCEVLWDLARCCAADDDAFLGKLSPGARRQLCHCLVLPAIAKFGDGQKDVYVELVIFGTD